MDRDRLVAQIVQQASQGAKRSGKITNALMPADQVEPEQIEQVLSGVAEEGIHVVDE
jgi:hypothetical protein